MRIKDEEKDKKGVDDIYNSLNELMKELFQILEEISKNNDTKKEYHLIGYKEPENSTRLSSIDPINTSEVGEA